MTAEEEIAALLDERVVVEGSEDMTLYRRVLDVVRSNEAWQELAMLRLREIRTLRANIAEALVSSDLSGACACGHGAALHGGYPSIVTGACTGCDCRRYHIDGAA